MGTGRDDAADQPRTPIRLVVFALVSASLLITDAVDRVSEQLFHHDLLSNATNDALAAGGLLGIVILCAVYTQRRSKIVRHAEVSSRLRSADLARDAAAKERKSQIRSVVRAGQSLRIVLQPIIDLSSGRVAGHEALARFDGGAGPGDLFRIAHAVGLGVELEMLAVNKALAAKPREGYLSINVGPDTLLSKEFLSALLDEPEPERIVVELTEHEEFKDYPVVQGVLKKIKRLGVRIAIDDAGSGVSSLQHIVRLSPDLIKLDRSLITLIDMDPVRRTLGVTLALFAREIGARLIAEGIERQEERDTCAEIGIAFGQGFLLGKPAEQPLVDLVGSLDVREAMRTA